MIRILAALVAVTGLWAAAAPPREMASSGVHRLQPPQPDAQQIAALLAQLEIAAWTQRQEASEKLIAMGPAALPALAEHRSRTSDVQTFAEIQVIEAQIALAMLRTGQPIYVRLESADAVAAITEIAEQAGVEPQVEERRLRGLVLDAEINGQTWWPALLALCESNDLDVRPSENALRITRATDGPVRMLGGPMSASGPFLVLARAARYERAIAFDRTPMLNRDGSLIAQQAQDVRQTRFVYDFEAMLEPRFALGGRKFNIVVSSAADDAGNSLLAGGAADGVDMTREIADAQRGAALDAALAASIIEGEWSGGRLRFGVPLVYPPEPGQRMSLAGRIRGLVGAEQEQAQATAVELSGGVSWLIAGERVNLRLEAASAAGRWALIAECSRVVSPEIADLISASLAAAELTDGAGDRFRRGAVHSGTGEDGRFSLRLEFAGPAEETMLPRTLRCRIPKRALELDEPFEFSDLPMP